MHLFDFSSVTPDEWEDFSNKNILKAEREKNSAINLRSIIDGILMQTLSDLQAQCEAVNLAFQKRIEETIEAKTKLEEHLAKVSLGNWKYKVWETGSSDPPPPC